MYHNSILKYLILPNSILLLWAKPAKSQMHFKSLNLRVPPKTTAVADLRGIIKIDSNLSLRLLFATSAAPKLSLQLSFTSLAKATSSALSLKSPSKMEPTIVRPRPAKQDCSLLVCDFSFESVDENPMVLPFKWKLFSSTFTWYYFLVRISNFLVCGWSPMVWPLKPKPLQQYFYMVPFN